MSFLGAPLSRFHQRFLDHEYIMLLFFFRENNDMVVEAEQNNLTEKKLFGLKSYVIKIRESIDIIVILHFYEKSTSRWYEG